MKDYRIYLLAALALALFAALGRADNAAGSNEPDARVAPEKIVSDHAGPCDPPTKSRWIFDHDDTDITKLTLAQINLAKNTLHIAYGHTSHGSQLTTGMTGLVAFADGGGLGLKHPAGTFAWNNGGKDGALDLHDRAMAGDLGHLGDTRWADRTRACLKNHTDVNVIVWSWCGGCSDNTEEGIKKYLDAMAALEKEYPQVVFVYMTGHLDHANDANLKKINQIIRDRCKSGKVLYDYADIESYDPDGKYFEFSSDNCDYYESATGKKLGNWADEWQAAHTEGVDWYNCPSAHSKPLNANRKAYAAWAMWVAIAQKITAKNE